LGPAVGVVASDAPVGFVSMVISAAVGVTPATPDAVVAPRFFVKYQIAAPTIARRINIHNQLTPPLSVAGGGVIGAGVTVVWAEATEETNRKAKAETRFIGLSSGSATRANPPSSKKVPSSWSLRHSRRAGEKTAPGIARNVPLWNGLGAAAGLIPLVDGYALLSADG
jgi:hypothetical protein